MTQPNLSMSFSIALVVISSQCQAEGIYQMFRALDGSRQVVEQQFALQSPQSGIRAYDNWRTATHGGVSRFRGAVRTGGDEFADDLQLVTSGPSMLSDMAWSIYNLSETATLSSYRTTIRFYDESMHLLGQDSYVDTITIGPRDGIVIYSDGGFFRPLQIPIPQQLFMSIQFSEIVGIDPADMATMAAGPRTTGYSTRYIRNLTSGQQIDLDGTDQTNLKFFIDTVSIPAPGSAAILFISILSVAGRRRR